MNEECPICLENITIEDTDEGLICFTCNHMYCRTCCNHQYIIEKNRCGVCNQDLKLDEDAELFALINISLEKTKETYLHLGIVFSKIASRYFNYNFLYSVELYRQAHDLGLEVPYIKIANKYFEIKDYQNAIIWYQVIPNSPEACLKLGIVYSILGNHDLAIKWYKKSAYLGNNISVGRLGYYFQEINKLDLAKSWYELGESLGDIISINNLAVLYIKEGNKIKALKLFKQASDKGNREAMFNLAMVYKEKGYNRKSRRLLRKSSELGYEPSLQLLTKSN
jgi:TPR repeat protein